MEDEDEDEVEGVVKGVVAGVGTVWGSVGDRRESKGGEKCVQRLLTIFVIRDIWLFCEHMNL